ncbi:MAG TPA: lysine--tRNA ligase, partial [Chthoniobacteraceae bacterium]|nr:lysine--tRNA ligase [Chthoniobacteraceae bacterium]
ALADALPDTSWTDDALQSKIFEVARMTPLEQPLAFKAIYRVLLDKEMGPKAGNLLAFLDRDFVVKRFRELPFERADFWRDTAIPMPELEQWLEKEREKIAEQTSQLIVDGALTANEFTFVMKDGKRLRKRVVTEGGLLA